MGQMKVEGILITDVTLRPTNGEPFYGYSIWKHEESAPAYLKSMVFEQVSFVMLAYSIYQALKSQCEDVDVNPNELTFCIKSTFRLLNLESEWAK